MNPSVIPIAVGKYQGRLGSLALFRQSVEEKENSDFNLAILYLKRDQVSHPVCDWLSKYIHLYIGQSHNL